MSAMFLLTVGDYIACNSITLMPCFAITGALVQKLKLGKHMPTVQAQYL
jgi:hypothetical protein